MHADYILVYNTFLYNFFVIQTGITTEKCLLRPSIVHPHLGILHLLLPAASFSQQSEDVNISMTEPPKTNKSVVFPTNPVCFTFTQDDENRKLKGPAGDSEGTNNDAVMDTNILAHHIEDGKLEISVLMCNRGQGCVVLCGFDLGAKYSVHTSENQGCRAAKDEIESVDSDRFSRDNLLMYMFHLLTG